MVGRAKSDTKKVQISRSHHDKWMAIALDRYHEERARILAPKERRKGVRQICQTVQQEHTDATGRSIHLSSSTLNRLVNGNLTKSASNAAKSWLLEEEVETVICYAVEVASRGFPLNHGRLKDCVDDICRARLGDAFPADGVGINWTHRFCEKYSDRLRTYWSTTLDNKRGRAVNPITNKAYFDLLEEVLAGKRDYEFDQVLSDDSGPPDNFVPVPIKPGNIYGSDESGFFPSGNVRQRVVGPTGKTTQHQQSDGGRENTTVMATICADGTYTCPVVIFKGKAFQVKWDQENPLNAS